MTDPEGTSAAIDPDTRLSIYAPAALVQQTRAVPPNVQRVRLDVTVADAV
jgi:hypothetical protein